MRAQALGAMPRVAALAGSALAAPFAGFGDVELHPSLSEKAAVLCSRVVRNHPLPDGNKRSGYAAMRLFIGLNGATFTHPAGGLDDTAATIESLAAGTMSEELFILWVAERVDSPP